MVEDGNTEAIYTYAYCFAASTSYISTRFGNKNKPTTAANTTTNTKFHRPKLTNAPHTHTTTTPQAFFFKDRLGLGHNERLVAMMGTWTEGLVGVSLIAIGLLGLKESLLDYEEAPVFEAKSAGSAVVDVGGGAAAKNNGGGGKAIFLNGVLHGFSWDGAPSLAPALALSSWGSVLWFLLAYCSGTMVRVTCHV